MNQHEFKLGELVYYDSLRGLIKGKLINIYRENHPNWYYTPYTTHYVIKSTVNQFPYKRGDLIDTTRNWIIPRNSVYTRSGIFHISPY